MENIDKEFTILENIYSKPQSIRQRDLAHIAGISLGMTNVIMKRLISKGFLTAQKINHRNIHYAVTPSGINEIMKRSYRYLKRTIKNIVLYKEKIIELIQEIKSQGYNKIVLVGKSDLDFIFDHCSREYKINLFNYIDSPISNLELNKDTFYIISEKLFDKTVRQCAHVFLDKFLNKISIIK